MARENYPKKGYREVAFKGRLRTADPPTTLAPEDFQTLTNLRYNRGSLKSVGGQTKINTTATTSTALKDGIFFQKDYPSAESHTLVASTTKIFDKTSEVITQGNFTDITPSLDGSGNPRLSVGPNGSVVACNGTDTLIWYGSEMPPAGFILWDSETSTFKMDFHDLVSNSLTSEYATLPAGVDNTPDANTMLLLHGDEITGTGNPKSTDDASDSDHTVQTWGHTVVSTTSKFGGGSFSLDGAGDYITIADHADFDFSGEEWTIEFWFYDNGPQLSYPNTQKTDIYYQVTDGSSTNLYLTQHGWTFGRDQISVHLAINGTDVVATSAVAGLGTNQWNHVAVVQNGASDYKIFCNGSLRVSSASATSPAAGNGNTVYIGGTGPNDDFLGFIDEFRISNTARYSSDFTPQSFAFGTGTITSAYVGSPLPLRGITFNLVSGYENATAATAVVNQWASSQWQSVTGQSDGTSSGGVTLAQSGKISFASTASTAKQKNVSDVLAFWYKVDFYNIDSTTRIYQITLDAALQQIQDLWDGVYTPCDVFIMLDGGTGAYNNWTPNVFSNEYDDANAGTFANLTITAAEDYLYVASLERLQGIRFSLAGGKENQVANVSMTVEYYSGNISEEWGGLNIVDGTLGDNGNSLGKSGTVSWTPPARSSEFKTQVSGIASSRDVGIAGRRSASRDYTENPEEEANDRRRWQGVNQEHNFLTAGQSKALRPIAPIDLYYYRIGFSANPTGALHIYNVACIPASLDVRGYKFPVFHDNSLFLCGNPDSEPNAVIYSAVGRPQVFNGEESGKLYIGDDTAPVCGASFSNQFGSTDTKILLMCKETSTWRITGEAPYAVHPVSMVDGCIAPYSIAVGEIEIAQGIRRKVAVWVSQRGVVISDGTSIQEISTDIRDKFTPLHSNYLGASVIPTLHGRIDPVYNEYVLVVPGSAEWRYDFTENKWFRVGRGSAAYLNGSFPVYDTNGISYMYGFTPAGFVMRLDNGNTFATTSSTNNITSTVRLGDIALYNASLMFQSRIDWASLMFKVKSTTTSNVTCNYYVDGNQTATTIDTVDPTRSGYVYVNREIHGQAKTGTFHSPEFTITTADETIGFEPVMWGCEYMIVPREK